MLWKFLILTQWHCRCLLPMQAYLGHTQTSSHLEETEPCFLGATIRGCELPVDLCEAVPDVPAPGPYPSWNLPSNKRVVRECSAQPQVWDVCGWTLSPHVQLCAMAGMRSWGWGGHPSVTVQDVTDLPPLACQSRETAGSLHSCSSVRAHRCAVHPPLAGSTNPSTLPGALKLLPAATMAAPASSSLQRQLKPGTGAEQHRENTSQPLLAWSLAPQQQAEGLESYERDLKTYEERQSAGRRRAPRTVWGGLSAQHLWCFRGTWCSLAQSELQTGPEALGAELASPSLKQPCQRAA